MNGYSKKEHAAQARDEVFVAKEYGKFTCEKRSFRAETLDGEQEPYDGIAG